MKYALAGLGFINGDINYNKNIIIDTIKKCSDNTDMIIFGESFLQGFDSLDFRSDEDFNIAIKVDSPIIQEICKYCHQFNTGVSFGFYEKDKSNIFSSQITIDKNGNIVDIYKRVSSTWKEEYANENYREGNGFHCFDLEGQKIVVALCGDLWFDENVKAINELNPDILFWPVYTDYNYEEWNNKEKFEYAKQAKKVNAKILYVNSYCLDRSEDAGAAKAGAVLFINGKIEKEASSGKEDILFLDI